MSNQDKLTEALKSRANAVRTAETDLETIGKLFSDLGVKVLADGQAHKFNEEPFLSGVITKAYAKIQTDERGAEEATMVVDVSDADGGIHNVFCNANLAIKFFGELGHPLRNLQWRRFVAETAEPGPRRDDFLATFNESCRELELFWVGILFTGKKTSRRSGYDYNDFQVVMAPKEATTNPDLLCALEAAVRPGESHLSERAALPEFIDDDI